MILFILIAYSERSQPTVLMLPRKSEGMAFHFHPRHHRENHSRSDMFCLKVIKVHLPQSKSNHGYNSTRLPSAEISATKVSQAGGPMAVMSAGSWWRRKRKFYAESKYRWVRFTSIFMGDEVEAAEIQSL